MTTVYSSWFQPDSRETRERMRVATGAEVGLQGISKLEHNGVITELEFQTGVVTPTRRRIWTLDYEDSEQAYYYEAALWLSTLNSPFAGEASYEAKLTAVGGASHMQDPWVGDLLTDLTTAINAQVAAGTHPGVPAGLFSWSVEFETDDDLYPGTVTGRELEVTATFLFGERFNRNGSPITGGASFDALAIVAIGRDHSDPFYDEASIDYADPPVFYSTNGPTGTPPDAWSSTTMEGRTAAVDPGTTVAADGGEVLGTVDVGDTVIIPVDDPTWEARAWDITRFGSDQNYGVPLLLAPVWLATNDGVPYPREDHTRGAYAATIYMNAVWTPPRYRIIYDVDYIPVTRQWPRRPDARGLSAGSRLHPAPKAARIVGGEQ